MILLAMDNKLLIDATFSLVTLHFSSKQNFLDEIEEKNQSSKIILKVKILFFKKGKLSYSFQRNVNFSIFFLLDDVRIETMQHV